MKPPTQCLHPSALHARTRPIHDKVLPKAASPPPHTQPTVQVLLSQQKVSSFPYSLVSIPTSSRGDRYLANRHKVINIANRHEVIDI